VGGNYHIFRQAISQDLKQVGNWNFAPKQGRLQWKADVPFILTRF